MFLRPLSLSLAQLRKKKKHEKPHRVAVSQLRGDPNELWENLNGSGQLICLRADGNEVVTVDPKALNLEHEGMFSHLAPTKPGLLLMA